MATMREDGDSICPLCAEEMDLTDQQLKPCKCGYEICVWCWHHIMDMAEKDDSEGRCPACRTPYDKERIVATTVKWDRTVAEVSAEKKQRSQKTKPKTSAEERKHLNSVRVVQKNLVYIIGLPINLSDESLLERKEYFGQYGKVLKVSISRAGGATTQHSSSNNTFSVYITYAREDEAIRCIQAVHNFVLEGKPLRARFGTTKYCHAWLRNMTCSNPDCLYLHDIASQEDSFSKDEMISAYTRSRVPQMASANLQRRSGNFLPPSVDDFSSCMASNKIILRATTNNITSHVKSSTCNLGKSTVLPSTASWGLRASNSPIPVGSVVCLQTHITQKAETPVEAAKQDSPWDDDVTASSLSEESKEVQIDSLSSTSGPLKSGVRRDSQTVSDLSAEASQVEICASSASAWDDDVLTALDIPEQTPLLHMTGPRLAEHAKSSAVMEIQISESDTSSGTPSDASPSSVISVGWPSAYLASESEGNETGLFDTGSNTNSVNNTSHGRLDRCNVFGPDEVFHNCSEDTRSVQTLCSAISSVSIDRHIMVDHPDLDENPTLGFNFSSAGMIKNLASTERSSSDINSEGLDKVALTHTVLSSKHVSRELSDWRLESQNQVLLSSGNKIKDPLLTIHDQRQRFSPVDNETCSSHFNYPFNVRSSNSSSDDVGQKASSVNEDSMAKNVGKPMLPVREDASVLFNEDKSLSNFCKTEKAFELHVKNLTYQKMNISGRSDGEVNIGKNKFSDIPESSIISDILSLDFDPWDDSLSSNDFAKLLGETNREDGSLLPTSLKSPISNQSRFSFARQENEHNRLGSFREVPEIQKSFSLLGDSYGDDHQKGNGFNRFVGPYDVNRDAVVSSNGHAGFPRSKILAPPGFSSVRLSKAPPGFSLQDRSEPTYVPSYTENNLHNTSLDTQYQVQQSDNMADVEFIDPAILAVGKERMPVGVNNISSLRPAFPVHFTSEADLRLQLLMQQSICSHQRQQIPDHMNDRFLTLNDVYSIPQPLPQNSSGLSQFAHLPLQQPRNSQSFSNHWEGWNSIQSANDAAMLERLRNERFGISNYYTGSEEFKFHVSNADLYGRAFGM